MSSLRWAAAAAVLIFAACASAQEFTSEAGFVGALNPNYYHETFSSFYFGTTLDGSTTDWDAPGNGVYDFHAYAANGLFSDNQALSTFYNQDTLAITFANSATPVYAVGGNFTEVDQYGNNIAAQVILDFSDGHKVTLTNQSPTDFYGYISSQRITEVDLVSDNSTYYEYVQLANFYVGQPTPEPVTIAALGLGAAALIRRRAKRL